MIITVVRRRLREEADSLQALEQKSRHQRSLQEILACAPIRVRHQIVRCYIDALVVTRFFCALLFLHFDDLLISSRVL